MKYEWEISLVSHIPKSEFSISVRRVLVHYQFCPEKCSRDEQNVPKLQKKKKKRQEYLLSENPCHIFFRETLL